MLAGFCQNFREIDVLYKNLIGFIRFTVVANMAAKPFWVVQYTNFDTLDNPLRRQGQPQMKDQFMYAPQSALENGGYTESFVKHTDLLSFWHHLTLDGGTSGIEIGTTTNTTFVTSGATPPNHVKEPHTSTFGRRIWCEHIISQGYAFQMFFMLYLPLLPVLAVTCALARTKVRILCWNLFPPSITAEGRTQTNQSAI